MKWKTKNRLWKKYQYFYEKIHDDPAMFSPPLPDMPSDAVLTAFAELDSGLPRTTEVNERELSGMVHAKKWHGWHIKSWAEEVKEGFLEIQELPQEFHEEINIMMANIKSIHVSTQILVGNIVRGIRQRIKNGLLYDIDLITMVPKQDGDDYFLIFCNREELGFEDPERFYKNSDVFTISSDIKNDVMILLKDEGFRVYERQ